MANAAPVVWEGGDRLEIKVWVVAARATFGPGAAGLRSRADRPRGIDSGVAGRIIGGIFGAKILRRALVPDRAAHSPLRRKVNVVRS